MQKELLDRALKIKEGFYGPGHHKVAKDLNSLAIAYGDSGDLDMEMQLLERALKGLDSRES